MARAVALCGGPGTPALSMTNQHWDQDGAPTEYAIDFPGPGRELVAEYVLDQRPDPGGGGVHDHPA